MRKIAIVILVSFSFVLVSFNVVEISKPSTEKNIIGASFSLINDTKDKVSIYTGTGFVSLNKGSKTSIGCNVGKEVRWAESGKKGDVIFKITKEMCGKTLKLSNLMK
ncbi:MULTISPECIES: hypothetical protein [Flavobacterium]|uniref:Uncharacterized protein n=1 Tax=Flavobacterium jumunjinense TaxID=998845 RepID=A0ABV5GPQ5_9FLAO|nr:MULTISPECIES: hypothetical protein [Flavobacterium]